MLAHRWTGQLADRLDLVEQPHYIPETMHAFRVLETFRQARTQLAIVVDEYGGTQGIVTLGDVLAVMVGDVATPEDLVSPPISRLDGSSWSVHGVTSMDELQEATGLEDLQTDEQVPYRTVGGFMMARLGRVPGIGDTVDWAGLRFEVIEMDRNRVHRLLIRTIDVNDGRPPSANGLGEPD
jgi:putative hemolysin